MSRSLTHRQITGVGCRARVGVGVPPTMRKLRACEGGLTMTTTEELLELERAAWKALSTDGETAAAFYEEVLAPSVLMLLPGGRVIDDREAAIESMSGERWSSFELEDERVVSLTDQSAVVAYRASAARGRPGPPALHHSKTGRESW